jgi:hypothetical protein
MRGRKPMTMTEILIISGWLLALLVIGLGLVVLAYKIIERKK